MLNDEILTSGELIRLNYYAVPDLNSSGNPGVFPNNKLAPKQLPSFQEPLLPLDNFGNGYPNSHIGRTF